MDEPRNPGQGADFDTLHNRETNYPNAGSDRSQASRLSLSEDGRVRAGGRLEEFEIDLTPIWSPDDPRLDRKSVV